MAIALIEAVHERGPDKPHQRLMLLALADHASPDGKCWPGIARLAQRCCIQPRQAKRTIAALEQAGWITVVRGRGSGHTNLYRLNLDRLLGQDSPGKGVTEDTPAREKVSSEAEKVSWEARETPGKGVMEDTRTVIPPDNPFENRQQSKRSRRASDARARAPLTDVDQAQEWLHAVHPLLAANRRTTPAARDAIAAGITPKQALDLFDAEGHKTESPPLLAALLGDLIHREADRRHREERERAERIEAQRARREAEQQPETPDSLDYPDHVAGLSPRRRAEWLFSEEGLAWQAEQMSPEQLAELQHGAG